MSTARHQVYHCRVCGNVVQVTVAATGQLVCCSRNMELLAEQDAAADAGHRLEREAAGGGLRVRLAPDHPMTDAHFIQWLEVILPERSCRRWLAPGEPAEAVFAVEPAAVLAVRAYCTEHGLWRA